jgi:hypothetical protein
MLLEPLAHAVRRAVRGGLFERGHVRRRRRRRRVEEVREDPLAAEHRRRAVRDGRLEQDAALAEQPAAILVLQRDPAERVAEHALDTVVIREALVDERVVRPDEVEHARVLEQHRPQKQLGLVQHVAAQVVVERREDARVGRLRVDEPQLEPLLGKVRYERIGPRVGQQPLNLRFEHLRITEPACDSFFAQPVVRNAVP